MNNHTVVQLNQFDSSLVNLIGCVIVLPFLGFNFVHHKENISLLENGTSWKCCILVTWTWYRIFEMPCRTTIQPCSYFTYKVLMKKLPASGWGWLFSLCLLSVRFFSHWTVIRLQCLQCCSLKNVIRLGSALNAGQPSINSQERNSSKGGECSQFMDLVGLEALKLVKGRHPSNEGKHCCLSVLMYIIGGG